MNDSLVSRWTFCSRRLSCQDFSFHQILKNWARNTVCLHFSVARSAIIHAFAMVDMISLLSVSSLLLICVLVLTAYYFVHPRSKNSLLPPGPAGVPLFGYAPFLSKYPWQDFHKLRAKYPDLIGLYMGKQYTVVLQSWDAIKAVIIDQGDVTAGRPQENAEGLKYFSTGTDGRVHGLFGLEGKKWKDTHTFCKSTIEELTDDRLILKHVENLTAAFRSSRSPLDPESTLHRFIVDVLTELLLGKTMSDEEFQGILCHVPLALSTVANSLVNQFPFLQRVPGPTKNGWNAIQDLVRTERAFFGAQLRAHKATFNPKNHQDFLDKCIVDDSFPSDDENDIISTLIAVWTAGGEATLVPTLWFVLFMCKYPDVQQKIYDEISQVVGTQRIVNGTDRGSLPYTTATMYETLRLGLSDPLGNPRSNVEEFYAFSCKIPKRTLILMNIWAVHRDPVHFPDPLEFRPERFLVEDDVVLPPQFIMFSVGVRHCPARVLGEAMLFLTFANLIQEFEIRPAAGQKLPPNDECRPGISGRPLNFMIDIKSRSRL